MKKELIDKINSIVNKYGIEHTLKMFDGSDIIRRVYQDNLLEFLNQFNDLNRIEKDNIICYVDKDRLLLFAYFQDRKNEVVYINYNKIWSFFYDVIGLDDKEIQDIIKNWLDEVYNLSGLTPINYLGVFSCLLKETNNLIHIK